MFDRGTIYEDIDIRKRTHVEETIDDGAAKEAVLFNVDNPSPKMIEEASRRGIDLKNTEVVKMIKKLQLEKSIFMQKITKKSCVDVDRNRKIRKNEGHQQLPRKLHSMMYIFVTIVIYFLRRSSREVSLLPTS